MLNSSEFKTADQPEVGPFRKILAYKTVEVFHSSLFPRMVGGAEVTSGFKFFADFCVSGKFKTVVVYQGFDLVVL